MKYIITIISIFSLVSCASTKHIKTKPHTYIVTPYHVYVADNPNTPPKEIF